MGISQIFQTEKDDLYPEETQKMKNFLDSTKIQDFCFSNEISGDRVYESLKKYMKTELIKFFELKKSTAIEEINKKIEEKNIDYDFNDFVNQVINIECGKDIYISKIYEEINEINKINDLFEINYFTVMLIGKTGVGKSTLINNLLKLQGEQQAKTGVGSFQTKEIKEYRSSNVPFLKLVDTRGIEINNYYGPNEIKEEAEKYIQKQYETKNINNFVQCIWYCITGNRFEDAEIEIIRNLRNTYNNKIPIIIVYTQASDDEMFEQMNKYIKGRNIDEKIINVLAYRKKLQGKYIESFGLKELIKETLKKYKDATKGGNNSEIGSGAGNVFTKKIGDYILEKISNNNKINLQNSYKNIVSQFITNYQNIKSEDEFLYFIIHLFEITINNFLNVEKIKEKTFSLLKNLSIIQNNSFEFIQFYNKYVNELIEPDIKTFAVDFMDYQVEIQKQKNKEIKLKNKKNIKEFSEMVSNFLNNNFYYLAQLYYIYNFIPKYCPNLLLCFEKKLNNTAKKLLNNSRVKERINDCFFHKFRQFQRKVNKSYHCNDINYTKSDNTKNLSYNENDLEFMKPTKKDSKIKINMTFVKNNFNTSKKSSNKSELLSESDTYKDETENSIENNLPSYNQFIKANIRNNNSAPTPKYDN